MNKIRINNNETSVIQKLKYVILGHNKFEFNGSDNIIELDSNVLLSDCRFVIEGKHNRISISQDCRLRGLHICIDGDNNTVILSNGIKVNASKDQPTYFVVAGGRSLVIGSRCLFSNNINVLTSDFHAINNPTGEKINQDADVFIGNSVWVCLGVVILKGVSIQDGNVIGAGSIVSSDINCNNSVLAGNPLRVIKDNITWSLTP